MYKKKVVGGLIDAQDKPLVEELTHRLFSAASVFEFARCEHLCGLALAR
jgi:hypothetical protein